MAGEQAIDTLALRRHSSLHSVPGTRDIRALCRWAWQTTGSGDLGCRSMSSCSPHCVDKPCILGKLRAAGVVSYWHIKQAPQEYRPSPTPTPAGTTCGRQAEPTRGFGSSHTVNYLQVGTSRLKSSSASWTLRDTSDVSSERMFFLGWLACAVGCSASVCTPSDRLC